MRKARLVVHGLDETNLFHATTAGLAHTDADWYDYVERFHEAIPMATESLFAVMCTPEGLSSYAMLARAIANVSPGDVLEIGCGSGQLVHDLIGGKPDLRYTGVDLCEAEIARGRIAFERYANVRLERARAAQS